MSRTVPPLLLADIQSGVTTLGALIRIVPVEAAYPAIGLSSVDKTLVFDNGDGDLTYSAAVGFFTNSFVTSADKEVGTSQAQGILEDPEFDLPISEDHVERGVYDYANYQVYLVNYEDLSHGAAEIDFGVTGRWNVKDGVVFAGELRSLITKLKQSIVKRDSRTCRARFGSQVGEERYPCLVNTGPLWKPFTISSIGAESDRTFTATGTDVAQPDGTYIRGMVRFLTGLNAGRSYEIETNLASGQVTLRFPTRWPIDLTDTGEIRIGCRKRFVEDCITIHNNGLNFRGEPHSPSGDAVRLNVPGAAIPPTNATTPPTDAPPVEEA